jgi:hypothetical protein
MWQRGSIRLSLLVVTVVGLMMGGLLPGCSDEPAQKFELPSGPPPNAEERKKAMEIEAKAPTRFKTKEMPKGVR